MTEIIRLAEESIGAFLVGKKVLDTKFTIAKYVVVKEAAKVMSSAVSLILFGIGLFSFVLVVLVGSGYWAGHYFAKPALTFLVPAISLLVILVILWVKRASVFHTFARQILDDLLE